MTSVLLPFPSQRVFARELAERLGARVGSLEWRHFPDGESLITVDEAVAGAHVAIVASLREPDAMALPLRFAAETARELGARSVGLIAPYLAYMRQDKRFRPGEAVSAPLFARFLEQSFEWLVTVDPHLHRISSLDSVFGIPARSIAAAPAVAEWIRSEVPDAILIGPDVESAQWVADIARRAEVPHQVLRKVRRGDRDVKISLPDAASARGRTPVIVDDIMSSGRTAIETLRQLAASGLPPAVCIAIHAVFAQDAHERIRAAGAARIVSTDTIAHPSNAISVVPLCAATCASLSSFLDDR